MVSDISEVLATHERKSLLRFLMCGSVDDGKSTLIGRLLYETQALYADQLAALEDDSRRAGTQDGELDFALLTDGLAAEREQGITIDVAYRHFSTEHRHFIVADAPGHEQYTRNMVTGASTADCAVILIDARLGVSRQTRRHSYLVALLGIEHVVVAVNKMDTVDYSQDRFDEIERTYGDVMERIEFPGDATCIPVSALRGVNVLERSEHTPWYDGPTLMGYLEGVEVESSTIGSPFRMPVQWVNRASSDFRGFAGTIVSGGVTSGDEIVAAPSGRRSRIERIVGADGDLERAIAGQAVTLTLAEQIDCSRGDVIATPADAPTVSDQLQATIVWMHEEPMLRGRNYLMRIGSATVGATVSPLKYKLNVDSLEHVAATHLELNEIGRCDLELSTPVAFDPYRANRDTGAFILIDRITNETVGAGLIEFALRRSQNIRWQAVTVDRAARSSALSQTPCVLWLTGLSGAGKSTIANRVEAELHRRGHHTYLLDGDNVRHGLNCDLGFTDADRVENIRRVAEVSKLMLDAGLIVIVSFISPFRSERRMARRLFDDGQFLEVFVDTPLAVAEERDTKGLYGKARSGQLANFTGIDSPYEPPEDPEIRLDTVAEAVEESVGRVLEALESRELVPRA
jgi:bifunctional enzyme CysN/CysC